MRFHEFGQNNKKVIILIHPSLVMWDYFEYVIPLMEKDYHLVIPALPGYDSDEKNNYTSVEAISIEIEQWLKTHDLMEVECIYGCSMGGSIVIKLLSNNKICIKNAVIDGGITPYQLPWIITRFIAIRDFLLVSLGKFGGIKIIQKAFATDDYSEEDINYVVNVMKMISYTTIWRTFESCNNYEMPKVVKTDCSSIEYWFTNAEENERAWDIDYIKKNFPQAQFRKFSKIGHGGLAALHPEMLVDGIKKLCHKEN